MRVHVQNIVNQEKNRIRQKERENNRIRCERIKKDPLAPYCEFIIKNVCEELGQSVEDIKGKCRDMEFVECRFLILSLINMNTSFKEYSAIFIEKDRTTFYNSIEKVDDFLMTPKQKARFEKLKNSCALSAYNRSVSVDKI